MPRNIDDKIEMTIPLYADFETNKPTWKPMQGRTDTDLLLTLSKDGEVFAVPDACEVTAKFYCYEKGQTELKDVYTIAKTNEDGSPNPNYNITILDSTIKIPANIAMTDFAGDIRMTVLVDCTTGGTSIPYVYRYSVEPLPGYKKVGGNINLVPYAKVDLTNVGNNVFLQKAHDSGVTTSVVAIDGGNA